MIVISTVAVMLASTLYYALPYITGSPKACDLTIVAQRNFHNYYGLIDIDNPLLCNNAEQSNSINSECRLFYDCMQVLPPGNLPLSNSMIVQALRGSGKTQIRQCILSRLPRENHILIKIYGVDINNYLENFVKNIDITSQRPFEKIREYWKQEHFLQVILTEIASRFIHEKYFPIVKENSNHISLQTRKEVATLLSFYSTKDPDTLCQMINILLHDITKCTIFGCSDLCDNSQSGYEDQNMFIELTEKHRKIKVKLETIATVTSLKALIAVLTKTKYSPKPLLERSYRDQLAVLINFLSTLHISTTIMVDSLDESTFFFDKKDTNLSTLQTFVDSMANDDVLQLALGNWGEGADMSNNCTFYIFIPQKSNAPVIIPWTRRDKIPIIDLKWDALQLINYADYIFDYLRSKSHHQCKRLPDICSILGGSELCLKSMKQLRHPRDFHIFFKALIQHMSTVCAQRNPPFNATKEDLDHVLTKIKSEILEE